MQINEAIAESHNTAKEKGFWDKPNWNIGEKLMLITSELGEALEADRKDKYADVANFNQGLTDESGQLSLIQTDNDEKFVKSFEANLKDKFEDELADATIRLFDLAGKMNIDLEYFMQMKMKYNKTRPNKHGKRY